jgi:hypothetical protein
VGTTRRGTAIRAGRAGRQPPARAQGAASARAHQDDSTRDGREGIAERRRTECAHQLDAPVPKQSQNLPKIMHEDTRPRPAERMQTTGGEHGPTGRQRPGQKAAANRSRRDFLGNLPNTPFCPGNRNVIGIMRVIFDMRSLTITYISSMRGRIGRDPWSGMASAGQSGPSTLVEAPLS